VHQDDCWSTLLPDQHQNWFKGELTEFSSRFILMTTDREKNRALKKPTPVTAQAAQTHVTRCNVIYILTFGEAERDL